MWLASWCPQGCLAPSAQHTTATDCMKLRTPATGHATHHELHGPWCHGRVHLLAGKARVGDTWHGKVQCTVKASCCCVLYTCNDCPIAFFFPRAYLHAQEMESPGRGQLALYHRLAAVTCCFAGLCTADTRVLVSFELRSNAVKETFLAEAQKEFKQVGSNSWTDSVLKHGICAKWVSPPCPVCHPTKQYTG